jgi:hypothetical protein
MKAALWSSNPPLGIVVRQEGEMALLSDNRSVVAGEDLNPGDVVRLGDDGKAYRVRDGETGFPLQRQEAVVMNRTWQQVNADGYMTTALTLRVGDGTRVEAEFVGRPEGLEPGDTVLMDRDGVLYYRNGNPIAGLRRWTIDRDPPPTYRTYGGQEFMVDEPYGPPAPKTGTFNVTEEEGPPAPRLGTFTW